MTDLYRYRIDCATCGDVDETVWRESAPSECPNNAGHTVNGVTTIGQQLETCPANPDGRPMNHSTPRKRGTYAYYTGSGDDSEDVMNYGGSDWDHLVQYHHDPSTKSITYVERTSDVATVTSSAAHGLAVGDVTDVEPVSDSTFAQADAIVLSVPSSTTFTFANTGDDSSSAAETGTVSGNKKKVLYVDLNSIDNETHIYSGLINWTGAKLDSMTFEIEPQVTDSSAGTSTNYNLYGGFLIVPASGDGTLTVDSGDIRLVQCVENEYGTRPAGYWDADFNTSTEEFENITPNALGTGEFNMFALPVTLARFINKAALLGDWGCDLGGYDITQLGHGGRCKITLQTRGDDHEWYWCANMRLYRKKTC